MRKGFLLIIFSVLTLNAVLAQPPGNRDLKQEKREKIQAEKIAFISSELDLSPEEAQVFWPVYNQYEDEIDKVRATRKKYMKELKKAKNLSGDRAYELFELIFETEKQESDIRLNYLAKFAQILDKKKAALVFIAEEKFKRELLKKLRKDNPPPHEGGMGPGHGGGPGGPGGGMGPGPRR